MASRALLPSLALFLTLAGCAQAPDPGTSGGPSGTGSQASTAPAPLVLDAPAWRIGQWWEWQVSFGTEVRPETFRSIVVEAGEGFVLASDREGMAKEEAAFGNPFLGAVGPELQMEGFGGAWDLLDFPLAPGKNWTATVPNVAWDVLAPATEVEVAMSARYDAALPGYRFMGHVAQGMLLEGTFLPATGWFGELKVYDIDPGQEELEFGFRAVGAGPSHTGSGFTASAKPLLVLWDGNGFTDDPAAGGQPFVDAQPTGTFTMSDGTGLYGIAVAESILGARALVLTDPGNTQRQMVSQGGMEGHGEVLWIDEAGMAGQWSVATAGAGGYSGAYVELYEVTLERLTL